VIQKLPDAKLKIEGYEKKCELCEVFESNRKLMKHCFVDHGIFDMFKCIKCQKEYFTGRQFQRHQNKCEKKKEILYFFSLIIVIKKI
jgi:hypothetical protein